MMRTFGGPKGTHNSPCTPFTPLDDIDLPTHHGTAESIVLRAARSLRWAPTAISDRISRRLTRARATSLCTATRTTLAAGLNLSLGIRSVATSCLPQSLPSPLPRSFPPTTARTRYGPSPSICASGAWAPRTLVCVRICFAASLPTL